MTSFSDLPTELTTDILAAAILQHPIPSCILAVNSRFNDIGQRIIYTSLRFKSESQLVRFALKRRFRSPHGHRAHRSYLRIHQHSKCARQEANGASHAAASTTAFEKTGAVCQDRTSDTTVKLLPYIPHSISVRVPGGRGYGTVFVGIKCVFEFCAEVAGERVLELDSLEFCLHSRTSDTTPWKISEALSLVNPRKFVWRGPDPPYHFTTAIVPYATYHVFHSIRTWSNLQSLALANVSFPPHGAFVPVSSSGTNITHDPVNTDEGFFLLLNALPKLRSVCIGEATAVPVRSIARLALAGPTTGSSTYSERGAGRRNSGLREIRLVDAYKKSTWRKRIRRKDLEAAALAVASSDIPVDSLYYAPTGEVDSVAVVRRIGEIVSCEAVH